MTGFTGRAMHKTGTRCVLPVILPTFKRIIILTADSYHTTYSVINVSCESCHGAGKLHVDFVNSNDYKNGKKIPGFYLQLIKAQGNWHK